MAFEPITIPLIHGKDSGSADLSAVAQAQQLLSAQNVSFAKRGAIRPRPGLTAQGTTTVMYDGSGATALATVFGTYAPTKIHVLEAAGSAIPVIQMHGRGLHRADNGDWVDGGALWSVRRADWVSAKNQAASNVALDHSIDVAPNLVALALTLPVQQPAAASANISFPIYTDAGTISGLMVNPVNATDNGTYRIASAAHQAVFWQPPGSANVVMMVAPTTLIPGSGSEHTIATNGHSSATSRNWCQRIWATWDGTDYYVAFVNNLNGITILKVDSLGSILGTMTVSVGSAASSLCLAVSGGRGHLVYSTTTPTVVSVVFDPATMTSSGLNISSWFKNPVDTNTCGVVCGINGTVGYVGWSAGPLGSTQGVAHMSRRSMTAATEIDAYTLDGVTGPTVFWGFVFPPTTIAGRVLVGVQRCHGVQFDPNNGPQAATWIVLDMTDGMNGMCPVAASADGEAGWLNRPGAAAVLSDGSLLFGAAEGISFGENAPETIALRPIKLTPQGAPSVQVDDLLLFGGSVSYAYDGLTFFELGWVEGAPDISVSASTGGSLTVGASYTLAAVWTFIDSTGRVSRSVPTPVATDTLSGSNQTINATVNLPQITAEKLVITELYMTEANPGASAPLYLVDSYTQREPANRQHTFTVTANPNTTAKELYTTGNVLADDRAPGDRGMVAVGNRVWCADAHYVYPSHATTSLVAPAWNLDVYPIEVPSAFGEVRGLGAVDDTVVVSCDNGVCVITGPGFDDSGQGAGWSVPSRVYQVGGPAQARGIVSLPAGVAWMGPEGLPYLLSRGLSGSCVGREEYANPETGTIDLVYQPGVRSLGWDSVSNPLLVYAGASLKVLDLVTGQWCEWTQAPLSVASSTSGLWLLFNASPWVATLDNATGADAGVDYTMSVRTAPLAVAAEPGLRSGWGRLRAVSPVFDTLGDHTVTVEVFADEARETICNKSATITTGAEVANWPNSRTPEFRMTRQRASFVEIQLSATPAAAEWTALDLWVSASKDRAPSRNRS